MYQLSTSIVSKEAKSNTYRFALAKFLLNYAKSQKLKEKNFIGIQILRWLKPNPTALNI